MAAWDAAVVALYKEHLRRTPSQAEVIPHRGNPRGMNGVEAAILASEEYTNKTKPADPGPTGDPATAVVLAAFAKKGITPRAGDVEYWVGKIAGNGGWANESNRAYWLNRMPMQYGGVGDYSESGRVGYDGNYYMDPNYRMEGGSTASAYDPATFGEFNEKWTQEFTPVPYTPSPAFAPTTPAQSPFSFTAPTVTPFTYEDFIPPTAADMTDDPGYKIRLAEGLKAIDTSAAAHGTLLTGGTLKGLTKYGQEQGSNEFQNVYNRKASTWTANRGNAMDVWNSKKSLSDTAFSQATSAWDRNATANESALNRENSVWQNNDAANYRNWTAQNQTKLTDYQQKYKIWFEQQQGAFDRLYKLSALGQNTAVAS